MGETVDRLGAFFLDGAVAATALLGFAALVMVALGQPARRLVIGRMVVLGSLAILPLAYFAPIRRISLATTLASISPPNFDLSAIGLEPPPSPWRRGLVALAALGTCGGLGALGLSFLAARRLISGTIEPSDETMATYLSLPCESWRRRPWVRVSLRAHAPVLVGWIFPTILIPPDLDEPEGADALRLGLLHELAHFERRDPLFGFASGLAVSLWFFVPPLWWVRRQMRLDQEFLADRRASARFGTGAAYASSLVGIASSRPGGEVESGDGSAAPGTRGLSALFQRVLMLVRCPFPVESQAPPVWAVTWSLGLAGATVFAASLTLQAEGPPMCKPGEASPVHGSLHVARLTLEPRYPGPQGLPPPYTLLRNLPPRFELVVDVYADPADLSEFAIAGRRLGPLPAEKGVALLTTGFHKVRLVRDDRGLMLWVAGRLIPDGPRDTPPPALLALEPAVGQIGRFRNLFLTY